MRVTYESTAGGSFEVSEDELKGKTKEEISEYISTIAGEMAAEDASDNVEWEIDEE